MLGVNLIELDPDEPMIVEVESAGERDLRASREKDFVLGALPGGEEVTAVDHRRGQVAMVDQRSAERGRQGVLVWRSKCSAGLVAHQLESVTAFDQRLALGGEPFQVDGFYLGAVLFTLAPPLRLLIVVEFALDPVGSAVEEIDGRPEQIVEVGLEAGVLQGDNQCIEDVGDGAGDGVPLGQRPRVEFILEGAEAIKLKFGEKVVGGR